MPPARKRQRSSGAVTAAPSTSIASISTSTATTTDTAARPATSTAPPATSTDHLPAETVNTHSSDEEVVLRNSSSHPDKGKGRAMPQLEHLSSPKALESDPDIEPLADFDGVDQQDTNNEVLDIFGDPLFPSPTQPAATPAEGTVPDQITIVLHFRIGEPLTHRRPRKNLPSPTPIIYKWSDDDYDILCLKIQQKVVAIQRTVNVEWERGSHPHLQPYHSATANQYLSLDSSLCNAQLRTAWLKEFRRTRSQDVVCNIYVYLRENQVAPAAATGSNSIAAAAQQRRATQSRILTQTAVIQHQPDPQHLGPIGTAHLARTAAHLPPSITPIAIPSTDTFRHMRHLDQQAAEIRQRQAQGVEADQQERRPLKIEAAGIVFEVRISASELRALLDLPDMNLNGLR